jgi:hypothetical protein
VHTTLAWKIQAVAKYVHRKRKNDIYTNINETKIEEPKLQTISTQQDIFPNTSSSPMTLLGTQLPSLEDGLECQPSLASSMSAVSTDQVKKELDNLNLKSLIVKKEIDSLNVVRSNLLWLLKKTVLLQQVLLF